MIEPGGGRWITVGLIVSLLVHVVTLGLLVSASAGAGEARTPRRDRQPTPDEIRFGLDAPPRATIDWLGVQDPSPEHVAPDEAESQQAALALDAAGGPAAPPSQMNEPAEESTNQPEPANAAESPAASIEAPERAEAVVPEVPLANESQAARPTEGDDQPTDLVLEVIERSSPSKAERAEPSPRADQGAGPTTGPGAADAPGLPSERESDATVKVATVDVRRWTSPAVGQGIEIRPVRPRWPTHFGLGRLTRPALVEITLHRPKDRPGGADGPAVVKLAEFVKVELPDGTVEVRSSGDDAVDSIVLNTIYQWTAIGAQIDELGEGETLKVRVRLFSVR